MENLDIARIDQFHIPSGNVHVDFDKYIRGFEILARANGIKGQQRLKDTLLAKGGKQLQEIYFLLPDAVSTPASETDVDAKPYDDCVTLLKEYFKAQTSKPYEKYLLRKVVQEGNEDFQSFVQRIRQQADRCGFKDKERTEEEIVDQIIFGTSSDSLRAELLKKDVTLEQALSKGKLQEGVVSQLKAFSGVANSVSRVDLKGNDSLEFIRCFGCGRSGHKQFEPSCPAKNQKCHECGVTGHFKIKCSKGKKRQMTGRSNPPSKRVRSIHVESDDGKEDNKHNFVFMVEARNVVFNGEKEAKVSVCVNGIQVIAVIDLGCPVTIVNASTYDYLIGKGLHEKDYIDGCDVSFLGYETHRPAIEITGSISVKMSYAGKSVRERIYIAPFGRENLLGKRAAEALGVLKVGPHVYDVTVKKPFRKIKGCCVKISVDKSVIPKVVPYRRMPLVSEDKIHEEVHRLEELDIIEKVPTDEITWISRMIAIGKGDGSYRLVTDMRESNRAIRRDYYPQPTVEKTMLLPKIAKLSKIDLKKEFYLCELAPECRHITGFATKGAYPDPERVKVIKSFRAPQNKEDFGLANFVSRFLPNISALTSPLRELLRKERVFTWGNNHQQALVQLKAAIFNEKCLSYFGVKKKTKLIADTSANETVVQLKAMNSNFGNPMRYTVDNSPQFDSEVFRQYCKQANIEIEYTTSFKPNMNGEVERFNRNLGKRIQIAFVENVDYRVAFYDNLQVYHNTKHSATGTSPSMSMLYREIRDGMPSIKSQSADINHEEIIRNHNLRKFNAIEQTNRKRKVQEDDLDVRDVVVFKNQGVKPGFVPRFGPIKFNIIEKTRAKCTIEAEDRSKRFVRDASHLKKVPPKKMKPGELDKEEGEDVMNLQTSVVTNSEKSRKIRVIKPPQKLQDYVRRIDVSIES